MKLAFDTISWPFFRYHCSSMAYACRVLTEDLIKDNIGISADFLKVLQMDTIEIMLMKFGRPVDQDTEIKPIMIFEMGTINEHLVKSIQVEFRKYQYHS